MAVTGLFARVMLWIIIIPAILVNTQDSDITLTRNVQSKVCSGEELTFTCVTRGSQILAWSSDEYIGGLGVQLEFTTLDTPGFLRASDENPQTLATLISADSDMRIMVSTLRIIVSDNTSYPSVTCEHRSSGRNETLTFQYLETPGPPVYLEAIEIENTRYKEDCVIFVEWTVPENIKERDVDYYIVEFPSGSINSLNSYVTFAPHIHNCTDNIVIRLRAVSRCGAVGNYSKDIKPTLLEQQDAVNGSFPTTMTVGIILAVLGLLCLGTNIIFTGCVYYVFRSKHRTLRNQDLSSPGIKPKQNTFDMSLQEENDGDGSVPKLLM